MNPIVLFGITLLFFLLVIAGMSIGVMFGRRAISGSCGGLGNQEGDGDGSCALCTNPSEACRELKRQMEASRVADEPDAVSPPAENESHAPGDKVEIDTYK